MVISLSGAPDSSWGAVDYNRVPLIAMVAGEPQREARRKRASSLMQAANATMAANMRVPVYFTELAVGIRLAAYGPGDPLLQAMCRHNSFLHRCGVQGVLEAGQ